MATFDEFYESLSDDSHQRGEYFEKVFIPWFLKTDPEWSSKVKEIWLWDEYPNRWGNDCGIDLVYEDLQGNHWAVQSKCVSPERDISKAEIDSFLSESSDSRIYGRLLIASTDGIGKNAQQVIDRQEKQVICFLLEHFRHSEVEFPSSPEDLSTGQRKQRLTPRPHQQEAIKNVVEGFQKEDRGQLLMACGTGKTLTSLWIKEALNSKRTLVLVPSLSLLSQTLREWTANSKEQFSWICVCSDKSVANQDRTADDMIERVSSLGVPVTSNPSDIRDFLKREDGGVVFSTYQSSELIVESQNNSLTPAFDITFADEAHRCTGKVSGAFGCVLDENKLRSKKRLFMTATPRVLSQKIKKKADDENIDLACMDDRSQFGEVFHQLSFSESIKKQLLSDYKVVIVGVDDPAVEASIINRTIVDTGADLQIDTETLANHIALAKAIRDYDLSRMITFHNRVKSARKFSEDHPSVLHWLSNTSRSTKTVFTSYVSGEMNAKNRNLQIHRLRSIDSEGVGILANARCLSEGVDVPTLDGIAFFDPRSSQVDIIQAVGRAIRKSQNKKDGYIILPVYLGNATDAEDQILQSRFSPIWQVILALKSQDDSIQEELDQLRVELGTRQDPGKVTTGLTRIIFDLPSTISTAFADSLRTILVRKTTDNWMEMYGELKRYIEDYGDTKVPNNFPRLGYWVGHQRAYRAKGKLSTYKIQLLDDLGFIWNLLDCEWQEKYELLKKRLLENKQVIIHRKDPDLGLWVTTQRVEKRKGAMPKSRVQQLESIGFIWDPIEQQWQKNYNLLRKFYDENGHTNVPSSHDQLGAWVGTQRKDKERGKISVEHLRLLDSVGFIWNKLEQDWNDNFDMLASFVKCHGHARVTLSHSSKLCNWVKSQRLSKSQGKLSDERFRKLDSIGFLWEVHEEKWEEKYALLLNYVEKHGHARVPDDHKTLGRWVANQRTSKKNNILATHKQRKLEQAGFVWEALKDKWQEKYDLLLQYKESNGDVDVPATYPELGPWTSRQRSLYASGRLSDKRSKLLDEVGFNWNPVGSRWESKFLLLQQYFKKHGHTDVPGNDPVLGNWVLNQRSRRSAGKLSEDRIELLNSIHFTWNTRELQWQEKFRLLKEYILSNGDADVPSRHEILGEWVSTQRKLWAQQALEDERLKLLDSVGFIWNAFEYRWEKQFASLRAFVEQGNDPSSSSMPPLMRSWLGTQKLAKKNGNLTERRSKLFDELNIDLGD